MLATKTFEKTDEKIGEGVSALVGRFLATLQCKDPTTAEAIALSVTTAIATMLATKTFEKTDEKIGEGWLTDKTNRRDSRPCVF
jgi:hypothetical protein